MQKWLTMDIEKLKNNLASVKKAITDSGMNGVQIIAASKTQSTETIDQLMSLDKSITLGENRVQELVEKFNPNYNWHFIGQLQSNKVKQIIDKVVLIHSLDRLSLAQEIEAQAKKRDKIVSALIEINIGSELSKGGIEPNELIEFAKQLSEFPHIKIEGIMSVAPAYLSGEKLDDCFKKLYGLFLETKVIKAQNFDIKMLSAGMTHDFIPAIKNGANMVRLGRVLFGD